MTRNAYLLALAIAAMGLTIDSARAGDIEYRFELTSPNGTPVTDVILYAAGGGLSDYDFWAADLPASGVSTLTHSVGFDATAAMILGVAERPAEAGKWDIIMWTNDAYAADAIGLAWNELFPRDRNPRHGEFTQLIRDAHAGDAAALATIDSVLNSADGLPTLFDPYGSYSIIQWTIVEPPIGNDIPTPGAGAVALVGVLGLLSMRRRSA